MKRTERDVAEPRWWTNPPEYVEVEEESHKCRCCGEVIADGDGIMFGDANDGTDACFCNQCIKAVFCTESKTSGESLLKETLYEFIHLDDVPRAFI